MLITRQPIQAAARSPMRPPSAPPNGEPIAYDAVRSSNTPDGRGDREREGVLEQEGRDHERAHVGRAGERVGDDRAP